MKPSRSLTQHYLSDAVSGFASYCIDYGAIHGTLVRMTAQRRMAADTDADYIAEALRRRSKWRP